jgi:serine/threonine-protein kinase HipA
MRANVSLYNDVIGTLELNGDRSQFQFNKSYIEHRPRRILSRRYEDLGLEGLREVGIHSKLPAFWSNYLPAEGSALRKLVAAQVGVREHSEMRLLVALGRDLPGAVTVDLDGDEPNETVSEFAVEPQQSAPLKFSLAGLQLKFSMTSSAERMTIPMSGEGGEWIVKMPDPYRGGVPELEAATMAWAKQSGVTVPECRLISVAQLDGIPVMQSLQDQQAFVIRRYDRPEPNRRIHQEDFNQLLGCEPSAKYNANGACPGGSYLNLARLILRWCGLEDCREFFRRLVLMVLCGNADAHLKNWSLYYPDPFKPRLAPAYDLVATVAYPDLDRELALRFLKERRFTAISMASFCELAEKTTDDREQRSALIQSTVDAIESTLRAWQEVREQFAPNAQARITEHLNALSLRPA